MQAVGELDQDHADVARHRDDHLAVVLGLRLVARLERQPGQLGHAVDEAGDLLAERRRHLLERCARVLDRVVQQRRAQRLGVEPHAGADLRDSDRVGDELLAGLAPLVGVMHARVDERLLDAVAVDLERRVIRVIRVLLDDREQVAEQLLLERRQIGALHERVRGRVTEAIDALAHRGDRGRGRALSRLRAVLRRRVLGAVSRLAASDRPAQPPGGGFVLLRYRLPSSYRFA